MLFKMLQLERGNLIFGHSAPGTPKRGPIKRVVDRIDTAKKFEKELVHLCKKKFGFDIEKAYDQSSTLFETFIQTRLGVTVAEQLLAAFKKNREYRTYLEAERKSRKSANESPKREDSYKAPAYFAEHVLVGLHLHRQSKEGKNLLLSFLSPNGELGTWLKKNNLDTKYTHNLTITAQQANSVGLAMKRIVLSYELQKTEIVLKEHPAEVKALEERVVKSADSLKEAVDKLYST